MTVRNDQWIIKQARKGMIEPFEPAQVRFVDGKRVISYGVTSYGYDMRVATEWLTFRAGVTVDPHASMEHLTDKTVAEVFTLQPHSFVLCRSVEYWRIPTDVLVTVLGKSTYARCGLIVNCTPMEPGWEGHLTIELSNPTPNPIKVYANQGIAQAIFTKGKPCTISYADRKGKYQGQKAEVVTAKI